MEHRAIEIRCTFSCGFCGEEGKIDVLRILNRASQAEEEETIDKVTCKSCNTSAPLAFGGD